MKIDNPVRYIFFLPQKQYVGMFSSSRRKGTHNHTVTDTVNNGNGGSEM